jgi:hypothetical protein
MPAAPQRPGPDVPALAADTGVGGVTLLVRGELLDRRPRKTTPPFVRSETNRLSE